MGVFQTSVLPEVRNLSEGEELEGTILHILSLSLALWMSHSGTYFSHPTIWLLLFAADIKLDGPD